MLNIVEAVVFVFAVVLSLVLFPCVLLYAKKQDLFEKHSLRSINKKIACRLGGIIMFPVCLFIYVLSTSFTHTSIDDSFVFYSISTCILYVLGVYDDLRGVGAKKKLLFQFIASIPLIVFLIKTNTLIIHSLPLTCLILCTISLAFALITNSINLLDGIDGLAASVAVFIALVFLFSYHQIGESAEIRIIVIWIGVMTVFFAYNVFGVFKSSIRLFMGDTGSYTIGGTIAWLMVILLSTSLNKTEIVNNNTVFLAVVPLSIPIMDLFRVVIHRFKKGRRLFLADMSHIHHKILLVTQSQHITLLIIWLVLIIFLSIDCLLYYSLNINVLIILSVNIILYTISNIILTKILGEKYE